MELKGTHTFAAAPLVVWDALHNSTILQSCIPGAQEVTWEGENAVHTQLSVGIGPFKGEGGITAQAAEHTAPSHMKLSFDHKGAHNSAAGNIVIDLAPDGAGTLLTYNGNASLGGMAAMLDNPLTRPLVEGQLNQFFSRLDARIK